MLVISFIAERQDQYRPDKIRTLVYLPKLSRLRDSQSLPGRVLGAVPFVTL